MLKSFKYPVSNPSGRNTVKKGSIINAFAERENWNGASCSYLVGTLGLLYTAAHPGGMGSTRDKEGRIARWEINICGIGN